MLLGFRDVDRGHLLENIVYLELVRIDYKVYIGKVGNTEIDFVAEKPRGKIYIHVSESLSSKETLECELKPLKLTKDNYEKIILSMDRSFVSSYDGIQTMNLIDWLVNIK